MSTSTKHLGHGLNLLILLLASMVGVLLIRKGVFQREVSNVDSKYSSVAKLVLQRGIGNGDVKVLVFVLSEECEYCSEAAPLYKRIVEGLRGTQVRTVAILPQSIGEARRYVEKIGLRVEQVMQMSLETTGVLNVPALILVSQRGIVERAVVGKLSAAQETELMSQLGIGTSEAAWASNSGGETPGADCLNAGDLMTAPLGAAGKIVLLDTRSRDEYEVWHIATARNVPVDEIEVRAQDELNQRDTIVVYSSQSDTKNRVARRILNEMGFGKVFWLCGGIQEWKAAGLIFPMGPVEIAAFSADQDQKVSSGPNSETSSITVSQAKSLVATKEAIIVDIRSVEAFARSHIEGSINVPLTRMMAGQYDELPRDKVVITYCACPSEESSKRAALLLRKDGYDHSAVLIGGLDAWEASGGRVPR